MVTHDLEYIKYAKTAIKMFNGEVVGEYDESDKQALLTELKSKRGNGDLKTSEDKSGNTQHV